MKKDLLGISTIQEKLSALSTPQKVLLFVGTFLLIGGLFYFLQYKDQLEQARRLSMNIAEQEKRLAAAKQAAARVAVLQQELAQAEEDFARLLAMLPDQKELPGLLESVSKLGAQVGLENILFQPQPERPHEFYSDIPVRLDLLGTYNEVAVFLDRVSKLDRILKVENLTMTRQKDSSRLKVDCTIVTYRFIEKPAQEAGPTKQQASPQKK
jgi:type IV pilus assembly protein PilO